MTTLWRGICREHPSYEIAKQGKAKPRGGHDNPNQHNLGNTESIFTSWTRERTVAENHATKYGATSGILLQKDFPTPLNQIISSDDEYYEDEVLVVGIVENAKVHLIEPKII